MFLDNTSILQRVNYLIQESKTVAQNPSYLSTSPQEIEKTTSLIKKHFSMNPFNKENQQRYREAMNKLSQKPAVQEIFEKLARAKETVKNAGKAMLKNSKKVVLAAVTVVLLLGASTQLSASPNKTAEFASFDKDSIVAAFENSAGTEIENVDDYMRQIVENINMNVFEHGIVDVKVGKGGERTTTTIKENTEYVKVEVGGVLKEYSERKLDGDGSKVTVSYNSSGSCSVQLQKDGVTFDSVIVGDQASIYGNMIGDDGQQLTVVYDETEGYQRLSTIAADENGYTAVHCQDMTRTVESSIAQ